jgi:glutamate dehydrogenase
MQYVDALSDVMLVSEGVTDHYKKPEFIFLGPDENTADYMDIAALYMKKIGYQYWKSFTTGKSVKLGGIPHDAHVKYIASRTVYY